VDSNVLAALMVPQAPGSREVRRAVVAAARAGETFITPVFCIGEFWRVVTEPRGYGAEASEALDFLRRWSQQAPVAHSNRRFETRFLGQLERQQPRGAAVFDLAIGLLALERGADELWTFDARFPPIEGLSIVNPASR
jgi:predicted nucleic acid-binding protein